MEVDDGRFQPHRDLRIASGDTLLEYRGRLVAGGNEAVAQLVAKSWDGFVIGINAAQGAPSLVLQGSKRPPFVNDQRFGRGSENRPGKHQLVMISAFMGVTCTRARFGVVKRM